jgi:GNAT superfamily N-acetyltransferase
MLSFRLMEQGDMRFWMDLTNSVGWGMTSEDFKRILRFSPKGCFIANVSGDNVGCVATTNYGKLAWIGNLVVDKDHRGNGYGEALMVKAITYLKSIGVRTIRLDSVPKAIPLYRRLGFRDEYWSLRFTGMAVKHEVTGIQGMKKVDLDEVTELDTRYFKAPRRKLLEYVYGNTPELCFTARINDVLIGYIMAKNGVNSVKIGPWIVVPGHAVVAEGLLFSVMNKRPGEKLWVGVPEENHTSVGILNRNGFESLPSSLRMCYGEQLLLENSKGVYGLGGPDKG